VGFTRRSMILDVYGIGFSEILPQIVTHKAKFEKHSLCKVKKGTER